MYENLNFEVPQRNHLKILKSTTKKPVDKIKWNSKNTKSQKGSNGTSHKGDKQKTNSILDGRVKPSFIISDTKYKQHA